jgi:hypothetical protein
MVAGSLALLDNHAIPPVPFRRNALEMIDLLPPTPLLRFVDPSVGKYLLIQHSNPLFTSKKAINPASY